MNLVDEGFDMAVRVGRPRDSSMIMRKLCDLRLITIAAPNWLEPHSAPETPEAVALLPCIIDTNFRDPGRWPFRQDGQAIAVPVILLPFRMQSSS